MFAWTWRTDPRALKNQEISKMVNMKNSMVHTNLNLIQYFSIFWQKKCKKFVFLEKNQNLGYFFLIIRKFKIKWKKKKKKKNVPRAIYSLYDKSKNLDFPWPYFSSYLVWKTAKNPPNWKAKKSLI